MTGGSVPTWQLARYRCPCCGEVMWLSPEEHQAAEERGCCGDCDWDGVERGLPVPPAPERVRR